MLKNILLRLSQPTSFAGIGLVVGTSCQVATSAVDLMTASGVILPALFAIFKDDKTNG
jgi:poly(3-hydroxybutyrate) depolymerase